MVLVPGNESTIFANQAYSYYKYWYHTSPTLTAPLIVSSWNKMHYRRTFRLESLPVKAMPFRALQILEAAGSFWFDLQGCFVLLASSI